MVLDGSSGGTGIAAVPGGPEPHRGQIVKRAAIVLSWTLLVCCAALAADPDALVRVERKAEDDLTVLRSAGLPVVMETNSCLLLRAASRDLDWLRGHDYDARILDADMEGWEYLTVGLRPDSDRKAVESAGTVLLAEENWLVVRVSSGFPVESLSPARVFVTRIPSEPVSVPKGGALPSLPAALDNLADPLVQKMVNTVSTAQIDQYWSDLATNAPTGTRYTQSQGCRDASTYCYNKLAASHLQAAYQTWSASDAPNVIGTHPGAINPENVFIVIGHLDDLPMSGLAPGADDNASGSVNVLESARVASCWAFRNTLKFITCTGEESGLLGSEAYADDAAARGENILGVINMDMIGWAGNGSPNPENLDLNYNAPSQDLGTRFAQASTTYGTGLAVDAFLCPSLNASDHYPFWTHGWKAVCGITDNEGYCSHSGNYPYYHTSSDTIAACGNKAFFYSVVKTSLATLAELGQPFKIAFDRGVYACDGSAVEIVLGDRDLNTSPSTVQTATVLVSSTTETTPESVVLTERTADSMIFTGTLPTTSGPPVHGDGLLSVAPGDTILGRYTDALDCDGATNVPYSVSASVDCEAPAITNVQAIDVTGSRATITWTTSEPATSVVHYGTVPPGGSTASSSSLVTSHSMALTGLAECSQYVYWVESVDEAGNAASDNHGGTYYAFETGKNVNPSYPSLDTPIAIPDNNSTGATSVITVSDANTVVDVDATVNITHTYDGDLDLSLITPAGASISLSNQRGGSGENFRGTIFDDEATTPISSGVAPFTGSYRPDSPLSAADGIGSAGTWKLKVVDKGPSDVGTIDGWTLSLSFPSAVCGPHASYQSHAAVEDSCAAGGAGDQDGIWDPGEDVRFRVSLKNDGTATLTGITATLTSTTPGVVLLDGVASYPDLAPGSIADSLEPHFTARLPRDLACGADVSFQLAVSSAQGSWPAAFAHTAGRLTFPSSTPLNETFAGGIPAGWTVVDGGSGGGASSTWTTSNPCARAAASPMSNPLAIVDSDCAGAGATQDEQLITTTLDLSTALTATLEFDEYFDWYNSGQSEIGDVDVRSSRTAGAWVNVLRQQGASSANPSHKTIDITSQAAGAANSQIRFRYYNASNEWYWQLDNVKVTTTAPAGCEMNACSAPAVPPPVPDGSFGAAMTATREVPDGTSIAVHWDVTTCAAGGYHLLYGSLATVASYTIGGSACDLGTSGSAVWTGVPTGDLWYTVVADDGAATEGSWGTDGTGAQRGGADPSAQCGMSARENGGTCP